MNISARCNFYHYQTKTVKTYSEIEVQIWNYFSKDTYMLYTMRNLSELHVRVHRCANYGCMLQICNRLHLRRKDAVCLHSTKRAWCYKQPLHICRRWCSKPLAPCSSAVQTFYRFDFYSTPLSLIICTQYPGNNDPSGTRKVWIHSKRNHLKSNQIGQPTILYVWV